MGAEISPNYSFWPKILAPDMLESQSRAPKLRITA